MVVQSRLIDLIDTMTDVLEMDQVRIRRLEQEVSRLRSIIDRDGASRPLSAPSSTPMYQQNFAPPPADGRRIDIPSFTGAAPTDYTTPPPPSPPAPGSQLPQTANPNTEARYVEALNKFNQGSYSDAASEFLDLSRTAPNSPFAPNFQYWLGESNYALGRFQEAIQNFQEVLETYPNSNKADDAQFKIAESYDKLGNISLARTNYQKLVAQYPASEYLSRASARLKRLQ